MNPEELWFKIDKEDLEIIKSYKWFKGSRYPLAHIYKNGKRTSLYMHKLLINTSEEVDHINGDGFDNRKSNLRIATRQQNAMNQHRVSPTTGYRGVYKKWNGFYAGLETKGKSIHFGVYKTAIEAARAYNKGAKQYFGEFAYLNKI